MTRQVPVFERPARHLRGRRPSGAPHKPHSNVTDAEPGLRACVPKTPVALAMLVVALGRRVSAQANRFHWIRRGGASRGRSLQRGSRCGRAP